MVDILMEWNRDRTVSDKIIDLQTATWILGCCIFVSPCDVALLYK